MFVKFSILKRKLKPNKKEGGIDIITTVQDVQTRNTVRIEYHVSQDSFDTQIKELAEAFFHGLEMAGKEAE